VQTCYTTRLSPTAAAIADLVRPGELTPNWTITRINVPQAFRGQGYASALLREILNDADNGHETLQLEVFPSGGLNYEQLEAWYKRYGFKEASTGYMVRKPQQPKRSSREILHDFGYTDDQINWMLLGR